MKFVSFTSSGLERIGIVLEHLPEHRILDVQRAHHIFTQAGHSTMYDFPSTMSEFLRRGESAMNEVRSLLAFVMEHADILHNTSVEYKESVLLSPVPRPSSMRDGYAFRQHVEAARRNRGVEMIPEFDEIPIFYFTNHQAVTGPGAVYVEDLHLEQLDFELECAIVIGKQGKNIPAHKADEYIAGLTIMNDWSARALQMKEMKLNLGPAKGKDFATSLGPWLVTLDELSDRITPTPNGNVYDLAMKCVINGKDVSVGNVKDMTWTFAQIIERASYGVTLYPGDVIGSGTCGTGCFLELNGSKVYSPAWWLTIGDVVECSIERLGTLSNTVAHA